MPWIVVKGRQPSLQFAVSYTYFRLVNISLSVKLVILYTLHYCITCYSALQYRTRGAYSYGTFRHRPIDLGLGVMTHMPFSALNGVV